ncbi:DEAD/DEAH box helicase family protein [Paraclostridium sordellii]|uniref:DEAD/DEAH box helicase family protein n=1 Tax=Paraclostridium bifermentans TaxID=1490 RepID=A0ABY8R449_PARBF|nr:DEAD/DEAH box helicase family protein [Paeniclostridium sordellii]WGX75477.1 DEAD/DEAH box helicase family protein [Paraclostridium bifermentans]CEN26845.1 Type III restriction enzyme [[Clostridium] sordellii] [Paeniclostridium sordellii]
MKKTKELTINEIWNKNRYKLWKGEVNHIIAPVGSGKTYWFFETIIKDYDLREVLYLCDTSNLRDATVMSEKYKDKCYEYKGSIEDGKITVMTYSLAGQMLESNSKFLNNFKLIMCDECHNLIKYKIKFDGAENKSFIYSRVINALETANSTLLMVTATHRSIKKQMDFDIANGYGLFNKSYQKFDFDKVESIRRLKDDFKFTFNNCRNLVKQLKCLDGFEHGAKAVIYTDKIDTILELEKIIEKIGLKAIGIWSTNNEKKTMNEERLFIRNSILKFGIIPDEVDVLIINGSYETGINIIDDRVEIVIVNSSDIDIQVQARGRVRKHIKGLYTLDLKIGITMDIKLSDKWINKELTAKDKKELVSEYQLYDSRNRAISWTTFKKILKENGYEIIPGKVLQRKGEQGKIKRLKTEIIKVVEL